jgi:hypothetical protein
VAVSGNHAYVADDMGWLSVVDVSRPVTPTRVGLVDFGSETGTVSVLDVAVMGNTAYAAIWYDERSDVAIVDVADPAAPRVIGRFDVPGVAWTVAVSGHVVYVADVLYGVHAWDVSDPTAPHHLGGNTTLSATFATVVDDRVYAIGYVPDPDAAEHPSSLPLARHLWVLDATDPSALPEIARLPLLDARSVAMDGNRIVVAGGSGGLYVVRASDNGEVVPTPTTGATRTPLPTATPHGGPGPTGTPRPTPTAVRPPSGVFLPVSVRWVPLNGR